MLSGLPADTFRGITVVDLSRLLPGPFCTMLFADLGARVIKIEGPDGGDYARWYPPRTDGHEAGYGAFFASVNRGKESLGLDLKTAEGLDLLRKLLMRADVLVESFRPGVLERLGLAVPAASASSARDAVAEALQFLALMTASLAKMGQDIAQLSWTEIGEVAEPPSGGRDTSSTLPHKANPTFSWQVMTSATLVQRNADLMLTAMRQEQERSGHGFLEGLAVPEAFIEAEACLDTLAKVLDGLQVDTARMRRNLDLTQGMVASEALQMALAAPLGRLAAHDLLHEACEAAARERRPLADVVADMPQITAHVPAAQVRELLDPERYLGMAALQVDRAVRAAEALQ